MYCWIFWEGVGTSNFTTTTGDFFQNVENGFWVDHYYDDQNIEKNIEIDFRCSDFTYGVENQNINYLWRITYGYQGL